jgi:hypothetical protein
MNTALSGKADTSALAAKADASTVAGKADASALTTVTDVLAALQAYVANPPVVPPTKTVDFDQTGELGIPANTSIATVYLRAANAYVVVASDPGSYTPLGGGDPLPRVFNFVLRTNTANGTDEATLSIRTPSEDYLLMTQNSSIEGQWFVTVTSSMSSDPPHVYVTPI